MPSGRSLACNGTTIIRPFPVTLSVLDTGVPEQTVDLARRIESAGYDRIWVTEHHTETQSACPSVMAAAVLASTTTLSVTVGGVLARIHSPYFIAQQLKLLPILYGDRIQFGVAGTLPDSPIRDAIAHPLAETPAAYRDRLIELRDRALMSAPTEALQARTGEPARILQRETLDHSQPDSRPVGSGARFVLRLRNVRRIGDVYSRTRLSLRVSRLPVPSGTEGRPPGCLPQIPNCRRRSIIRRRFRALCSVDHRRPNDSGKKSTRDATHVRPAFWGLSKNLQPRSSTIAQDTTADEIVVQPLSSDFATRVATLEGLYEPLTGPACPTASLIGRRWLRHVSEQLFRFRTRIRRSLRLPGV